jgi:hypothetical protein
MLGTHSMLVKSYAITSSSHKLYLFTCKARPHHLVIRFHQVASDIVSKLDARLFATEDTAQAFTVSCTDLATRPELVPR